MTCFLKKGPVLAAGMAIVALCSRITLRPVIGLVDALVVGLAVDAYPVRTVDASRVRVSRADRESAGDSQPAVLGCRDALYFVRGLDEILILAENNRDVVTPLPGHANDVECDAYVNALLLADEYRGGSAVGHGHGLVAVFEMTGNGPDSAGAHDGEFSGPKVVPSGVVFYLRDSGVEMDRVQLPAACLADGGGKGLHVVIRVVVAVRVFDGVEEILAVEEGDCTLGRRLNAHRASLRSSRVDAENDNPAGGPEADPTGSRYSA